MSLAGCQFDVINIKNFHGILRYLFQILATPLKQINWFSFKENRFSEKVWRIWEPPLFQAIVWPVV